jgi:hypothetical protein
VNGDTKEGLVAPSLSNTDEACNYFCLSPELGHFRGMEPRFLLLAVVLATTVSSQAGLKEDATEYGEKLAQDLFEHGERNQEAIYTREVTGANMYGYHSQGDIDSFVAVASHVAHEKGAELEKHKEEETIVLSALTALYAVEEKGYEERLSHAKTHEEIQQIPETAFGLKDDWDKFNARWKAGSMTAQEVYDATMKDIAEKTAVQVPAPAAPNTAAAPTSTSSTVTNVVSAITKNRWTTDSLIVSGTLTNTSTVAVSITGIDARGFNQDQKMVTRGSDFTIFHNDLAPGEIVNFKVALKDDAKKVKFVQVMPTWTP